MKSFAIVLLASALLPAQIPAAGPQSSAIFNVRDHGAVGDGVTLDTDAINRTIAAAAVAGGGKVEFPAGNYLSFSIHLKSNVTLALDEGAALIAATPAPGFGAYDPPEANESGDKFPYQDFGHSHWHNSLIWGEDLENVSILGPGCIYGKGLARNVGARRADGPNGTPATFPVGGTTATKGSAPLPVGVAAPAAFPGGVMGVGNKAIALKNCRKVAIRDLSLLSCGHFAVLASGVDQLNLENVTADTNRDGFDIDACRQVTISRCRVNTPNDDAIVLKSSYALGVFRDTEDVRVVDCTVSGYDVGTLLDGTRQKT